MKKLALGIGMAMGLAVSSTPVLAGEFIVENDVDYIIYAGCGPRYSVAAGSESRVIDCAWGIHIRQQPDGDSAMHTHDCSDPSPIHRIRVTDGSDMAVAIDGQPGMGFKHSCESAL